MKSGGKNVSLTLMFIFFLITSFQLLHQVYQSRYLFELGVWTESKKNPLPQGKIKKKKRMLRIFSAIVKLHRLSNRASTKSSHLIPTYSKVKGQIFYWNVLNQLAFMMESRHTGHLVTFQTFTVGKLPRPACPALWALIPHWKTPKVPPECLKFQPCACALFQPDSNWYWSLGVH